MAVRAATDCQRVTRGRRLPPFPRPASGRRDGSISRIDAGRQQPVLHGPRTLISSTPSRHTPPNGLS